MRQQNVGLTLIEMMIVTALLSIFSIFIVNLIVVTQKAWTIEHTAVPIRNEAKRSLEVMAKELREGDPSAPGGVAIGGTGNSQNITFSVPNQVSQTSILSWRQVQFTHQTDSAQCSNNTQITPCVTRTTNGTTAIIGRNINSLQFTQANNIVTATVGTSKATPEGATLQTTLSSQVRLRN